MLFLRDWLGPSGIAKIKNDHRPITEARKVTNEEREMGKSGRN